MSVLVKGSGGKKYHGVNFITDLLDLGEETTTLKTVLAVTPHMNTTTSPSTSCAYPDGTIFRASSSTVTILNAKGKEILKLTGLSIGITNNSLFRVKNPSKQIYYCVNASGTLFAFDVDNQSYHSTNGISFIYFDKWNHLIAVRHNSSEATALVLDDTTLGMLNTVPIYADKNFNGTLASATQIFHTTGNSYTNDRPFFDNRNWTVLPISDITVDGSKVNKNTLSFYIDNRVDVSKSGVILHYYEDNAGGYFGYLSKNDEYLIICDNATYSFKIYDFSDLKKGELITTIPYYSNGTVSYHFSSPFICKDGREVTIGVGNSGYPIILSRKDGEFNLIPFTTSINVMVNNISRFSLREKTGSLFVDYGSNVIQCGIEMEDYK